LGLAVLIGALEGHIGSPRTGLCCFGPHWDMALLGLAVLIGTLEEHIGSPRTGLCCFGPHWDLASLGLAVLIGTLGLTVASHIGVVVVRSTSHVAGGTPQIT
jgi:hypothetical protein